MVEFDQPIAGWLQAIKADSQLVALVVDDDALAIVIKGLDLWPGMTSTAFLKSISLHSSEPISRKAGCPQIARRLNCAGQGSEMAHLALRLQRRCPDHQPVHLKI
jgi:hypothetical protein